jgi:hypothetical protein
MPVRLKYCLSWKKRLTKRWSFKFCSNKCQGKWREKKYRTHMLQCGCLPYAINGKSGKKHLIEIRGHCCEICKNTKWQGLPIPLVLDHIDGNASNCHLTNLRLVCGNCDMQLPTYKNKNCGKGRAWRRERYALSKSY